MDFFLSFPQENKTRRAECGDTNILVFGKLKIPNNDDV